MDALTGGLLVGPHQLQAGHIALARQIGKPDVAVDLVGQHFLYARFLLRRQEEALVCLTFANPIAIAFHGVCGCGDRHVIDK